MIPPVLKFRQDRKQLLRHGHKFIIITNTASKFLLLVRSWFIPIRDMYSSIYFTE